MSNDRHCPECGCVISGDLYTADKMRQAFFANLHEVYASLPDHKRRQFPNVEILRKHALIACGHCDVMTVACGSKSAAPGVAAAFRLKDQYCIANIDGSVVTVMTARSMARRELKAPQFRKLALELFAWIKNQTGIDAGEMEQAA